MRFDEPGADDPEVGDSLVTADDITIGDIVYFDRVESHRLLLRKLHPWEMCKPGARLLRVRRGDEPGTVWLAPVQS